jgi:hypothetical protein
VKSSWKTAVLTFAAGSALLIPAAIGMNENGPTILSPLPALTVFPAFAFGIFLHAFGAFSDMWYAAALLPMLLFFFWLPGLFWGDGKIPRRTYALLAVATVFSVFWFVRSWQWGIDYNGLKYTFTLCFVNAGVVSFLAVAFFRNSKKEPSYAASLVLHWILFGWLAWYAFPWLGETGI